MLQLSGFIEIIYISVLEEASTMSCVDNLTVSSIFLQEYLGICNVTSDSSTCLVLV